MAVASHLRVGHPALGRDGVGHAAIAFDALVQGAIGVIRCLLGNRQVLTTGGRSSLGLACALGSLSLLLGQTLLRLLLGELLGGAALLIEALLLLRLTLLLLFLLTLGNPLTRQGSVFELLRLHARLNGRDNRRFDWRRLRRDDRFGRGRCRGDRRRQADQLGGQGAHLRLLRRTALPLAEQPHQHQPVQRQRAERRTGIATPAARRTWRAQQRHNRQQRGRHCGASVISPRLLTPPCCRAAMPATTCT